MNTTAAVAALATYAKGAAPSDRQTQVAALIADLLELVDGPDAVLDEARTQYSKEHPESSPATSEYRCMEVADDVADHRREEWRALRRSLGSLRGNITRAMNANDAPRVKRLRERERELNAQARLARLEFTEAAVKAKSLRQAWLDRLDGQLALIEDDEE